MFKVLSVMPMLLAFVANTTDATVISSPCDETDKMAPCACRVHLTSMITYKDGKEIIVEFSEAVCNREVVRKNPPFYQCVQLRSEKTLYRDASGKGIEIPVSYRAGCELRCTTPRCLKAMCQEEQKWERKAKICRPYINPKLVVA